MGARKSSKVRFLKMTRKSWKKQLKRQLSGLMTICLQRKKNTKRNRSHLRALQTQSSNPWLVVQEACQVVCRVVCLEVCLVVCQVACLTLGEQHLEDQHRLQMSQKVVQPLRRLIKH